jgi:4-amino-4-deoxy-L-arabinose transferase-like glycosyltransferase
MARRFLLPLLLVSALCPYFIDLDGSSIWDANEAFYVETPREMMERGDYINPTFNYEPRLNKPVLSYWMVAAFYQAFGVSVGVQRIPIAIGALVLIATAFFLARAASPDGAMDAAGWWAALGLAISPRLVMFGRRIFIDIYISMFMALTLLFFALAERYPQRRRLFLILMYVCVGLGVLTKGPVALVLPALVFGGYLLAQREPGRMREMLIPLGALIVLAIVVPWYAALYAQSGWAPIVSFVLGENVARYTEGLGVNASRGPLFYLPVIFSDAFPWSVFLFVAAAAWFDDRRRPVAERDAGFRVRTLLWLWILVIVGFFSLSAAKQDLYIFPIVPAIAAVAGVMVARAFQQGTSAVRPSSGPGAGTPGLRRTTVAIGALLVILGAGVLYLFQTSLAVYRLEGTALAGGMAIAGGACAVVLALVRRSREALLTIAAVMIAVNWLFVLRVLPSFEAYKPAPGFAKVLKTRAGPNDQIVTYNVALPSLVYYLRRHTDVFYDHEPVLLLLESGRTVYLMLPRHDYETIILPAVKVRTCIVSRQPMFDVKLKSVLARERLPELLLVTNRCD